MIIINMNKQLNNAVSPSSYKYAETSELNSFRERGREGGKEREREREGGIATRNAARIIVRCFAVDYLYAIITI